MRALDPVYLVGRARDICTYDTGAATETCSAGVPLRPLGWAIAMGARPTDPKVQ